MNHNQNQTKKTRLRYLLIFKLPFLDFKLLSEHFQNRDEGKSIFFLKVSIVWWRKP
jgi:hypothetical protein